MSTDHRLSLPMEAAGTAGLRSWLRVPWDIVMMALGILYWGVFGTLLTLVGVTLALS